MDTLIQVLVSVIIPGIILALIKKKIDYQGPRLVYYVSAATWFVNIPITSPEGKQTGQVNLHAITVAIKNNGTVVAKNVDISHFNKPSHFQIVPSVSHQVLQSTNPTTVIRVESLNPGETIWISYLFNFIIDPKTFIEYVRSQESIGTRTSMILNQAYPNSLNMTLLVLAILGLIFIGLFIWWIYPPTVFGLKWLFNFPR